MVINRMTDKKQYLADYSFEYFVDDGKRLTGLFWADGLCKLNYMEFGDVISFDATFKTNRYKMVFVPFTGIDNHSHLGCWHQRSFGRQPNVVVTDQDPAMKQAIEEVFPISRHRSCMWHIMKKVADKVGHELCNNDEFKRRMCDIVWTDSIEPEEFEKQWKLVMIEFGLTENKWIDDMFGMRSMWIPAFYRHEPMSSFMRTTSRSEKIHGTISECLPMDTKVEGPRIRILLKDFKAHGDGLLEVWFKNLENDVTAQCSCLRFEQYGLLCKHIYFLFKMFGVKEIPNKYVMKRWTKDVVPNELNVKYNLNVGGKDVHQRAKRIAREIIHTGKYLGKKKMNGVQIEDGVRDKDNEGEDDEEEDDFEDYISDDGSEEEDQWEEVSGDEDDEDE
ncbi:protein FAR1-RELATED SEQUENCE 2-like [Helianthus annuus]|uniref:protein FAR1-RELATED SEQUENCE 2-like n=1 Tax=Helianthus annuus TaxID=4232 RepID=UPI001652BC7C|nr:protein FAR1-RELATED SEQUENCE 2-like [Helianthus annuus]